MEIKIGGNEVFCKIKDKFEKYKKLDKKDIEILINLTNILNETIKLKTDLIERQTEIIEKKTEENYRLNDILRIKQYYEKRYIPIEEIEKLYNDFITVRNEIIKEQEEKNRPMITYDLVRNDFCESMILSLIRKHKGE